MLQNRDRQTERQTCVCRRVAIGNWTLLAFTRSCTCWEWLDSEERRAVPRRCSVRLSDVCSRSVHIDCMYSPRVITWSPSSTHATHRNAPHRPWKNREWSDGQCGWTLCLRGVVSQWSRVSLNIYWTQQQQQQHAGRCWSMSSRQLCSTQWRSETRS